MAHCRLGNIVHRIPAEIHKSRPRGRHGSTRAAEHARRVGYAPGVPRRRRIHSRQRSSPSVCGCDLPPLGLLSVPILNERMFVSDLNAQIDQRVLGEQN